MVSVERAVAEDASLFATLEQAPDTKEYILPYSQHEHAQRMLDPSVVYLRILDGADIGRYSSTKW